MSWYPAVFSVPAVSSLARHVYDTSVLVMGVLSLQMASGLRRKVSVNVPSSPTCSPPFAAVGSSTRVGDAR